MIEIHNVTKKHGKKTAVEGWEDRAAAERVVREAQERWRKAGEHD